MREYEGRLSSLGSNIVVGIRNKNGFQQGALKFEGLVLQASVSEPRMLGQAVCRSAARWSRLPHLLRVLRCGFEGMGAPTS